MGLGQAIKVINIRKGQKFSPSDERDRVLTALAGPVYHTCRGGPCVYVRVMDNNSHRRCRFHFLPDESVVIVR